MMASFELSLDVSKESQLTTVWLTPAVAIVKYGAAACSGTLHRYQLVPESN